MNMNYVKKKEVETFATQTQIRKEISSGGMNRDTSGLSPGYAQANLVIAPKD